jgi:hypothetical protein
MLQLRLGIVSILLCSCGGGGGGNGALPVMTNTVGGLVTGLKGTGLTLQNNGTSPLAISTSGAFVFQNGLAGGSAYNVTVATQPSSPTQNCVVVNGSGTMGKVNVTDITIDCAPTPFTVLLNQPPTPGYLTLLLTDGSVMMQTNNDAGAFYKLTPDSDGAYVNGTWRKLASPPAGYAPYAGAQAVLADGRVLFVGGEYNQNQYVLPFAPSGLTNMSAVYDPVSDSWTMIAPPPGVPYIGDPPSAVLPDGSFVFGTKLGRDMWRLDPLTLTWSPLSATNKAGNFAEEGWTLLPGGGLFSIDVGNAPHAEHYDPVTGQWYGDGPTPAALTSPTNSPAGLTYGPAPVQVVGGITYGPGPAGTYFPPGEIGPALLLPDGRLFVTGAAAGGSPAHTALYTPDTTLTSAGRFVAGPDFVAGDDAGDSSAALLPSGHVLIAAPSGRFYEFDGTAMSVTGSLPNDAGNTAYFLLVLPNGEVLVTGGTTQIYGGLGHADPTWAPTIANAPTTLTRGSTFNISGTQFNGLSQAGSVGDEFNVASNYPLVRIANSASGHVVYARTHGHSTMGVATGSVTVSTHFDIPSNTEPGASTISVIANGITSSPVSVVVN